MKSSKVKIANNLYLSGDYYGALKIYYELACEMGHIFFYANITLCLDKLDVTVQSINAISIDLAGKRKFDILSELFAKDVIVSLTSYPARIHTVSEAIKSILAQSFKPYKVVLWLAKEQFPDFEKNLPPELSQLKDVGLSIEWCEDIKSYKKLIPCIKKYPDKIIVTADDDIIYDKHWLVQLLITHIQDPEAIICHRAHQILLDDSGNFAPYKRWPKEIKKESPSFSYLFTGCGGVLYPPDSLHSSVQNQVAFSHICPTGDDLWFWSMAVLNGTRIRIVKESSFKLAFVPETQATALWVNNVHGGGNDAMLRTLRIHYPEILERLKEDKYPTKGALPQVSIIVPVFNTGEYLVTCLNSIMTQSFQNFEVLCIDDGSTDELTKNILNKYSLKDSRIRIVRQQNSGPATARNKGLMIAKGKYIAFVDSDDYISDSYISNLYYSIKQTRADISVADKILCIDKKNPSLEKKSGFELYGKIDAKQLAAEAILATGVSWNKMYNRIFLLNHNIKYLDGMRCQSEDNYFSIIVMMAGYKSITIAKHATYYYRQHENGITKNITKKSFDKSILIYEEVKKRLENSVLHDKKYWLNIVNQRALKDLRYSATRLFGDVSKVRDLLTQKFSSTIDICCIADEKYIVPTLVFLESIKRTKHKTTLLSITVLIPKGSKQDMKVLEELADSNFSVDLLEIDTDQFENLHKYNEKDNYCIASPSAMFKFIIPNVFSHLDRILYIDTDLIVRKDLLELFMTSMEDEYLCAVPDLWTPVTDRKDIKKFTSYFNSGVMLMNLARMRSENLPVKLIEAKLNSTNFNLMDQDIFNEVCDGHIKILDIKFNFLPVCYKRHKRKFNINTINQLYGASYTKIEDIATDPVVAHWAGADKPWVSTSTLFSDEWASIYNSLKMKGYLDEQSVLALRK